MKKFILFAVVAMVALCSVPVRSEDGEMIEVTCVLNDHNKIHVRLNKSSTLSALKVLKGGVGSFSEYMKDKLKNIRQLNKACHGGWIGEPDYKTAVEMFTEGRVEFAAKAEKIKQSEDAFLHMKTERELDYDKNFGHFYIGE